MSIASAGDLANNAARQDYPSQQTGPALFGLDALCIALLGVHFILSTVFPLLHAIPLTYLSLVLLVLSARRIRIPSGVFPVMLLFLSILVISVISIYADLKRMDTYPIQGILRYLSYGAYFLLVYHSRVSLRQLFVLVTTIAVVSVLVFYFQRFTTGAVRAHSLFAHSNHYAYFLGFAALISLAYLRSRSSSLVAILLYGAAIVATKSLGGLIVFFVAVSAFLLVNVKKGRGFIFFMALCSVPLLYKLQEERFNELADMSTLSDQLAAQDAGGGSSLRWRVVYWYIIINKTIAANNIVWGNGIGTTSAGSPYELEGTTLDPHNDYVRVIAEAGVVGFTLYVLMYFMIFRALKYYKNGFSACWTPQQQKQFQSLYIMLYALLFSQTSGNVIVSTAVVWMNCAFFAIVLRDAVDSHKNAKVGLPAAEPPGSIPLSLAES